MSEWLGGVVTVLVLAVVAVLVLQAVGNMIPKSAGEELNDACRQLYEANGTSRHCREIGYP